jgi:hypothetical protein
VFRLELGVLVVNRERCHSVEGLRSLVGKVDVVLEVCDSCVGFVQLVCPLSLGCLPTFGNIDFTLEGVEWLWQAMPQ